MAGAKKKRAPKRETTTEHPIFRWPETREELDEAPDTSIPLVFELGSSNNEIVGEILKFNGASECDDGSDLFWGQMDECGWNSTWKLANHFCDMNEVLGIKDRLADTIQKHPRYAEFGGMLPMTFVLPRDQQGLGEAMAADQSRRWIVKPPMGVAGKGIQVIDSAAGVPKGWVVVSEYIMRPLLIKGYKFDLRVYVLVTSLDPLRAFVCREGLARFCTEKYSSDSRTRFAHLTNAAVAKLSGKWAPDKYKWRMTRLLEEVGKRYGVPPDVLFGRIGEIVRLTLAAAQPKFGKATRVRAGGRRFELLGFDILVDEGFQMHLLEVNVNASIQTDEPVDFEVKPQLVAQALSIVGVGVRRPTVESEDAANAVSGNGFVRVLPCDDPLTNSLMVCAVVKAASK
jgi:hypothetical protein